MRRIPWALMVLLMIAAGSAGSAPRKMRILFVGGDWKAQLPNYQGHTPLRGYFVRQEVEKAAPGRFDFTLWTSYEFLQYGSAESLRQFDVVVAGDTMGESVMPRLVRAVSSFVAGGGGFMYCDNHKAFSFYTKELSFDDVLPIHVVPFRPFGPEENQPVCTDSPLNVKVAAADHPIMKGLDFTAAPPLQSAHFGEPKPGSVVLARSPSGKPIWVAWDHGKGRGLWTGGLFSNDELSEQFSKWPRFGALYAQALEWLGAHATAQAPPMEHGVADATLTVDLTHRGPALTAAHFGIHGQEDNPGGSYPMKGADLALYEALNLDGAFARTGVASPGDYVPVLPGGQFKFMNLGTDVTHFDGAKLKFAKEQTVLADLDRIHTVPIFMAWCPWYPPMYPDPKTYTVYFAASLENANGIPGTPGYHPRVKLFEVMNEPNLKPATEALPKYADFFNYAATTLHKRFPGLQIGCGGFYEWTYFQSIVDRCGRNMDWFSRHPYGHTGEAIFALQDKYKQYATAHGAPDLKFIITEWDFWIYGEPAFDYIMQRWKPVADHADTCEGTMQYRWREYSEGGYVFGLHGEFDQTYGELPPEWPNPGKDKPITYRYDAFWLMRDCRGGQYAAHLDVPAFHGDECERAYAIATSDGKRYNIVVYNGYPYSDTAAARTYDKVKVHIRAAIPAGVKGRALTISRADARTRTVEPSQHVSGDMIDTTIVVPALSGVSLTVQ